MSKGTKKSKGVNLSKVRDDELVPVARDILLALSARTDLVMGSGDSITTEGASEYYREKYMEVIIPKLIAANIKVADLDYLFQLMAQPVNFIKEITMSSFAMNRDIADAGLYGVKDIHALRVNELDKALKDIAAKNVKKSEETAKTKAEERTK